MKHSLSRWLIVLVSGAVLLVAVMFWFAGGSPETIVALGTFALAIATTWMAISTRDMAEATRDEARLSQEALVVAQQSAEASREQAEAVDRSLLASIQPILTRLVLSATDRGIDRVQLEQVPRRAMSFEQEHLGRVQVHHDTRSGYDDVLISVPFRNVGVGSALVRNAIVELEGGYSWEHQHLTNAIVAPGERTRVTFSIPLNEDLISEIDPLLRSFQVRVQYQNVFGSGRLWTIAEVRKHETASEFQVDRIILEDERGRVYSAISSRLASD